MRLLKNKGFWIGMLALFLCYLAHSVYVWRIAIEEPLVNHRPSAMIYSLQGLFFGGVILIFPIAVCLPGYAWNRRKVPAHENTVSKKERLRKITEHFVAGAMTAVCPFIVHTLIWNVIAMPVNPLGFSAHELSFYGIFNDIYGIAYGIPMYLILGMGMFLCGGTYAVLYLTIADLFSDRMAAFVFPSIVYYLWLKIGTQFEQIKLPLPADLFNDSLTLKYAVISIAIYVTILSVCVLYSLLPLNRGESHAKKNRCMQ